MKTVGAPRTKAGPDATPIAPARGTIHPQYEFLQILRFVAAALVLLAHGSFYFQERIDPGMPLWHTEVGVSIFFMISGIVMVVASARLPRDARGAGLFMSRRLLRVVPLYWLVTLLKIAISLILPAAVLHNPFEVAAAIKSFLFVPYFNSEHQIRPLHGVGWTLLHEMFFYVVFAAMLLFRRNPARWTSLVILGLWLAGLALAPRSAPLIVATSPINLNFVLGMLVGTTMLSGRGAWTWALAAALLMTALLGHWLGDAAIILFDPLVLAAGGLVVAIGTHRMPAALRPLSRLGDSSYALYLFHPIITPPVLLLLAHARLPGNVTVIVLAVMLVIGISHAIHALVEVPLNNLARRLFRRTDPRDPLIIEATKP